MINTNNFIIEEQNNTYKISQHENGMYLGERMSIYNDNDISATTALTMNEIFGWIEKQETI